MLNWLWGFMIIIGIVYALITGNIESVTQGAFGYIVTNMISNFLGLGWAATPAGIKAMKEMAVLNENKSIASCDMCTFLVINISSIQLIPVNIIAYRSQYGSPDPTAILFPSIIATTISTLVAVIFCRLMTRRER